MNQPDRVPVLPIGDLSAATILTRWRRQLRLTVVAKASFAFAPGTVMDFAPPVALATRDLHYAGSPSRSVRAPLDLAPHVERAQVVFSGHAYARAAPVERMPVRLAIEGGHGLLVDKRLEVLGDRTRPGDRPAPFDRMPLVFERAFGGPGCADNPLGVGIGERSELSPNVVHEAPARAREPASLGPIAASWPCRAGLLGGLAPPTFEQPVLELPDVFPWAYFQVAPRDQRMEALSGSEYIVLEGLSARDSAIRMRLPPVRAAARLYSGADRRHLALVPDTLFIDGDAETCAVTYRASVVLLEDAMLMGLGVAAGLETPGRPIAWPRSFDAADLLAAESPGLRGASAGATLSFDDVDIGALHPAARPVPERPLPFVATVPVVPSGAARAELPGAPWATMKAARVAAPRPYEQTIALTDLEELLAAAPQTEPPAPPAAPGAAPPRSPAEIWRRAPAPDPAPGAKPRSRVHVARPAVKIGSLYKKFGAS